MSALIPNSPKLTVILPVYNAVEYVAKAIDSVLVQTFNDFELILIDDGSIDGSLEVLTQLAASDSRIILVSRENRGLVATLNEGLGRAKGEFVARMDADDIAIPDRFSKQLDFLEASGYDICGASVQCFDQSEHLWRYPKTPELVEIQLLFDSPFAHPVVMFRTKALKALKYSDSHPDVEDYDLWQRAWEFGLKGGNLDDVLLRYRVHSKQISQKHLLRQRNLANVVRRRHWLAIVGKEYRLEIESLFKMLDGKGGDFSDVAIFIQKVAQRYYGEGRALFLSQVFRVAISGAATSSQPWNTWRQLLEKCDVEKNISQEVILFAVWVLRIGPQSRAYQWAKSFYLGGKLR